jgi:hypothetical protein
MSEAENKALFRRLLEVLGVLASGRRVAVSFIAIVRNVDGKLAGSGEAWTTPTSYGRCAAARPHPA